MWWPYVGLFLAVTASWAGVPAIGAAALGAAAISASQGQLDLTAVILVATVAGEVGGLIGYFVGQRWGRQLVQAPGRSQARRERMLQKGEQAYARWGRLAVFVTPAVVSGTARMPFGQFVVWNLIDSLLFSVSVAASAYGIGRLASGSTSPHSMLTLLVGLAVATLLIWLGVRRHRRRKATRAAAPGETDSVGPAGGG